MRKNGAKKTAERPYGTTTKYLTRWLDAKHSAVTIQGMSGDAAEHKGRRKATDLLLEDLYIVWRTLAGLPVWPDLYSVRRGVYHGGKPCVNEGRVLTLDEAFDIIGDLSPRAASAPDPEPEALDDEEDGEEAAAE